MKHASLALIVSLALVAPLAACGGAGPTPSAPGSPGSGTPGAASAAPGCRDIGAGMRATIAAAIDDPANRAAKLAAFDQGLGPAMTDACAADAWPRDAIDCFAVMRTSLDGHACMLSLSRAQRQALYARAHDRSQAVLFGGGATGIDACDAYVRRIETYETCGLAPERTRRDALDQAHALARAWREATPAAAAPGRREQIASACQRADGAIAAAARDVGCEP